MEKHLRDFPPVFVDVACAATLAASSATRCVGTPGTVRYGAGKSVGSYCLMGSETTTKNKPPVSEVLTNMVNSGIIR